MNQPIEKSDLARIVGKGTLVRAEDFDEEDGLWEVKVLCRGMKRGGGDIETVSPKGLIPLAKKEGIGEVSADQLPEWFNFDYGAWPSTHYGLTLTVVPGGDVVDLVLAEGFDNSESTISVSVAQVEDELNALFGFIFSHT